MTTSFQMEPQAERRNSVSPTSISAARNVSLVPPRQRSHVRDLDTTRARLRSERADHLAGLCYGPRVMSNLRWLCLVASVACAACSDSGDDDTATGGATNQAGTGGSSASSGTGGSLAGTGGSSAGTGGSGGASVGGTGGTSGTGGNAGNAARAGSTSGSAGKATGPLPSGSIGTDSVDCRASEACGAGTACCNDTAGYKCVDAFESCECAAKGICTVEGCDDAGDCPGAVCCALFNPRQTPLYVGTSCKAECDPATESPVCVDDSDCPSGICSNSPTGFRACF